MKLKLNVARRVVTFYFLLGSSIQCLLSAGIRSYFTQRDVSWKMGQMYLSIVEKYFSVEATYNLRIGLVNKHSTQKVVLLILPSFLNIIFSLVFKSKAVMFRLSFIISSNGLLSNNCPSILQLRYVNVSPIIWLPLFFVE